MPPDAKMNHHQKTSNVKRELLNLPPPQDIGDEHISYPSHGFCPG